MRRACYKLRILWERKRERTANVFNSLFTMAVEVAATMVGLAKRRDAAR
jgi:hypothetical protein